MLGLRQLVRFEGTPAELLQRLQSYTLPGGSPVKTGRSHHVRFFVASCDHTSSPGAQPRETLYSWVQEDDARMHEMSRDRTTTDIVSRLEARAYFLEYVK